MTWQDERDGRAARMEEPEMGTQLRELVQAAYAERAAQHWQVAETIYAPEELAELPRTAVTSALGLDHPVSAAALRPGEIVLDIGCGGGIDTLLAARAVGVEGQAIGVDVTEAMLELAATSARTLGLGNARFLRGTMEAIPLPDASVDVVISNGVFNLAADKDQVFAEAWRVLRPTGRFVVADMLLNRDLPAAVRDNPGLWSG